jgi:hypothetical protein
MQTNLTPSQKARRQASRKRIFPGRAKHRRPQPKRQPAWLDTLDAIDERCHRIETMAGLLRACGDPEEMSVRLAASAGAFMADDLRQVKALLGEITRTTP